MSVNKLYCRRNFIDQANLLDNSNADDPIENGWTIKNGEWGRKSNNPLPLTGDNYFYAMNSCDAEIYQDISIVNDFYNQYYLLTMQVRNKEGYDTSEAVAEFYKYCSIDKTYKTGQFNDAKGWQYIDMFMPRKSHANKLRVKLINKRNKGLSNDGYTDEIILYKVNAKDVKYHLFNETNFLDTDLTLNYETINFNQNSVWNVRDNSLVQCTNSSLTGSLGDKGSHFILKSKLYGSRYVVQTSLKSVDNGMNGLVFSKVDDSNYYSVLLSFGETENKLYLIKYTDNYTVLGHTSLQNIIKDHFYSLRIEKYDDEINVFLNGIKYIKEYDSDLEHGYVGLVSINNANSKFRYLFAGHN